MRNTLQTIILAALFFAAGCSHYDRELMGDPQPAQPEAVAEQQGPQYQADEALPAEDAMEVGMFNDLTYYGQWHHLEPYGWVWRPTVVMDWQPFLNGHWIWSQYGWMWVDYDPWGWATSHYGYWTTDFALGWVWIPDYQWSPVQCDWMAFDDFICWAPVAPPGSRFKEPWEGDKAWVSVPVRKFKENNVANYRVTPKLKGDSSERTMSRGAPNRNDMDRYGQKSYLVEVTLDRRVVGEKEFARVKFPPDIERQIQTNAPVGVNPSRGWSPSVGYTPTTGGDMDNDDGGGGGSVSKPSSQSKSKDSGSKDSGGKTETKYKDRNDKKDDGKTKGDSTTTKKGKG